MLQQVTAVEAALTVHQQEPNGSLVAAAVNQELQTCQVLLTAVKRSCTEVQACKYSPGKALADMALKLASGQVSHLRKKSFATHYDCWTMAGGHGGHHVSDSHIAQLVVCWCPWLHACPYPALVPQAINSEPHTAAACSIPETKAKRRQACSNSRCAILLPTFTCVLKFAGARKLGKPCCWPSQEAE